MEDILDIVNRCQDVLDLSYLDISQDEICEIITL